MKCELCNRENLLNFHHLIPVSQHSNRWFKQRYTRSELSQGINICANECHKEIHRIIPEKQMGKFYNTKKLLMTHPKIKKYLKWVNRRQIEKQI